MAAIKVFSSRRKADCGIVCLAMLLSSRDPKITYEIVSRAIHKFNPYASRRGVSLKNLEEAARYLGYGLKRLARGRYSIQGATGILGVKDDSKWEHVVILKEGQIIETDEDHRVPQGVVKQVWSADAWMRHYKARPCTLLVLDDSQ